LAGRRIIVGVGAGIAAYRDGDRTRAEQWLRRSAELLPTAPALYYLGSIARDSGRTDEALGFFRNAAASNSEIGRQAAADYAVLDLPRNPGNYIAAAAQVDARGMLVAVIENRSPVAIAEVILTPVVLDTAGRVVEQGRAIRYARPLAPGTRTAIETGVGAMTPETLQRVRIRIDSAQPAPR
jgi:tetratricopeptide (TPR) repeat protein